MAYKPDTFDINTMYKQMPTTGAKPKYIINNDFDQNWLKIITLRYKTSIDRKVSEISTLVMNKDFLSIIETNRLFNDFNQSIE